MKRIISLIIALIIAIPLALGIVAGMSYYTTTDTIVPRPALTAISTSVVPDGFTWRQPVFGGMIYRDFEQASEGDAVDVGMLNDSVLPLTFPEGYDGTAQVSLGGQTLWSGSAAEFANYRFNNNGTYLVEVKCTSSTEDLQAGYGSFDYHFQFSVAVTPDLEYSNSWVAQGDVMAIRLFNVPTGAAPVAEADLGAVNFMDVGGGVLLAFVPVSHEVESGSYAVKVTLDEYEWDITIRSIEQSFKVIYEQDENAELDEEAKQAAEASKQWMNQQYYDTVWPILDQSDSTRHWTGLFTMPAQGNIINDYGTYVYTGTSTTPTRSTGIDIQADRGTPVVAPAGGVVVYAGQLTSPGNMIVVEHGGGLKSLFLHLDTIEVSVGDVLEQGQQIGTVGSTGNATFNYLHYELRQNRASINPNTLFDGTSNYYYFDRVSA